MRGRRTTTATSCALGNGSVTSARFGGTGCLSADGASRPREVRCSTSNIPLALFGVVCYNLITVREEPTGKKRRTKQCLTSRSSTATATPSATCVTTTTTRPPSSATTPLWRSWMTRAGSASTGCTVRPPASIWAGSPRSWRACSTSA